MKSILGVLLAIALLLTGCDTANPAHVISDPPITVSVNNTPHVIITDNYGFSAEITPFNELKVAQEVKVAGTVFIGNTLDTNFITSNSTGTGSVTQGGGQLILQTGLGANGYAVGLTVRRGRLIAGTSNRAKLVLQTDAGTANNTRRWGIEDIPGSGNFTVTDGAIFQLSGTTFSVVTIRGGVSSTVSSGSFNGRYGTTYTLDTNVHDFEIYYSSYRVYFAIDGILLHTVNASTAPWTNTDTLYIGMDNRNSGGLASNLSLYCRSMSISRLAPEISDPTYKHITGAITTVCKFGAGTLHEILVNNPTANAITIYDNTSAAGTVIGIITPLNNSSPFALHYDLPFYTGLTVVTAGSVDLTIIYE